MTLASVQRSQTIPQQSAMPHTVSCPRVHALLFMTAAMVSMPKGQHNKRATHEWPFALSRPVTAIKALDYGVGRHAGRLHGSWMGLLKVSWVQSSATLEKWQLRASVLPRQSCCLPLAPSALRAACRSSSLQQKGPCQMLSHTPGGITHHLCELTSFRETLNRTWGTFVPQLPPNLLLLFQKRSPFQHK